MNRIFFAAFPLLVVAAGANAEEQYCTGDGSPLPQQQILFQLEGQGFQKIRKIDMEHGCFEAKGFDQDGNRVEVYVEPATGEIVKIKKS
jgi:hypothetical protein